MIKGLKAFHLNNIGNNIVFGTVVQETPYFYAVEKISKINGNIKKLYTETVSKFDVKFIEEEVSANRRLLEV